MALETKQIVLCIKKVLRSSIRKSYRCVSEHPVLFSLGVLLYLLYRSSPGFFAFLLSSSPVIICTTLLLGILLSYGDMNLPGANEDSKVTPEISAFNVGNSSSDVGFEVNERISVPSFRNNTANFKEREMKQTVFVRESSSEHVELDDDVPLLRRVAEEDARFERRDVPNTLTPFPSMVNFHQEAGVMVDLNFNQESESKDSLLMMDKADRHTSLFEGVLLSGLNEKKASFGMFSSSDNVNKHGEMEEKLNQERVFTDSEASKMREIFEEKSTEEVAATNRPTCAVSVRQVKKIDELKIDTSKADDDNLLDSSLGSPWARVGSQDGSSGFDSDRAESSSPDASMTDIAPVLDEIDPLLGADSICPDPILKDDSDTDSHVSSQDHQTDDDSNDEDGNNDAKYSVVGKKDDRKEGAFIWTADDEKNVMDLGYSEMERNRRLEILMVRRRSRKNIRFELDNNLIDVGSNDAGRSVDDLSRFRAQVPHISVPRRNPFDLPYDPVEAAIPGSAPSILHTRKDPFDLPIEHSNDSAVSAHDNLNPGKPVITSHHDMFFRRHDSFNFGSTDAAQERRLSRLKPYFVPETMEESTSNFQRQFSDKSESKLSSVTESDMASSVADQEDHKDYDENDVHREHQSPALLRQDSDLADAGSECSDGINSVDVELDHSDIDDREIALQHFVFERSQEREAYLASTKGKNREVDNTLMPLHPVADLLSWEDGDGESSVVVKSYFEPNTIVEYSEWVSSSRPAEEHESGSGGLQDYLDAGVAASSNKIVIGASYPVENDGNTDFMSYSTNEMPLDNLIHGSMELLSDFGKETLPEISRDLHPIPEERVVENFNIQEKHETTTFTSSSTALNNLHVIEEHFDVGSEVSLSSAVVSVYPPQVSDSIESRSVEARDISNPFMSMASEPDRVVMVDMKEETTSGCLLDDDDDDDKIYPEPVEDNGIDENFLSELDVVGDFRVEPMTLNQQVPDLGSHTDYPANGIAEDSLISPQTSGNIFLTMSDDSALDSGELSPLVDDLNGTEPEFSWSLGASHDDPEQTVYNPRQRILEARSFEAMNTELKPPCDETEVPSVKTPSSAVGSSDMEATKNGSATTITDAEMMVLDAKSPEDVETAFKQVSDGGIDEPNMGTETSHVSGVEVDSEPLEGLGQLHLIDAKSVEDICAAFKEHSGDVVNSCLEENKDKDECGETAEFAKHEKLPEGTHVESLHVVGDDREPELTKTASNMSSTEARTLDDIDAVFKRLSDGHAKSTVQAMESENACEIRDESVQQ